MFNINEVGCSVAPAKDQIVKSGIDKMCVARSEHHWALVATFGSWHTQMCSGIGDWTLGFDHWKIVALICKLIMIENPSYL